MDLQRIIWRPENRSKLREKRLYKRFLNNASQGLSFSEEVVSEMGAVSYIKHDFSWLFHPSGPLAPDTTLKEIRKQKNKEIHCNRNPLTQKPPTVNSEAFFKIHSDQSNECDTFGRMGQIRILNEHTSLKKPSTEDWKARSRNSRWQELAQKKLGKTREQCFINQQIPQQCQSRSEPLLPLRKQHRVLGCVSSPVSMNVQNSLNKTATNVDVKYSEIPQASRLQDIQNPCNSSHHRKTITGEGSTVRRGQVDLSEYVSELGDPRPPELSRQEDTRQLLHYKPVTDLSSLRYAVEKWRTFLNIKLPRQSVTIGGLKRALIDPDYPVRLEAIITCASGAVNGPQQNPDPGKAAQCEGWNMHAVPQELQDLIVSALDDPVRRVQMAAAVCQYAMRTSNSQAKYILQSAIKQDPSGTDADSWVAAQCLAIDGDRSQAVIQRLLSQHFLSDSPSDQKKSLTLLCSISRNTTLVRSLLAEELNNANCRIRIQACKSISQLRGPINKDLCNKLIHMMWNDWSCDVRQAAAQALSKLDVGRDLHHILRVKLEEGPTAQRLDALIFIGQLNIMTPKLLPTFLQCFNDEFVAVRRQACMTAAFLMIDDQMVLDQLVYLMENDPLWEVKVEAIHALGKIGCISSSLQELLMWAVHLEKEPRVRIAACEALGTLKAKGPKLQHFLQERYALEPNTEVHRHIEGLLKKHGCSLESDESKIQEIKQQVALLCTKHTISLKVLLMEEMEKHQQQKLLC